MFNMSRREFGESLAGVALLPRTENPATYAIIGAGVFGAWTAYTLVSAGHQVILLDEYGPASSRASSGGESRIIRCAYGPDEVYTRMAKRSRTSPSHRRAMDREARQCLREPEQRDAPKSTSPVSRSVPCRSSAPVSANSHRPRRDGHIRIRERSADGSGGSCARCGKVCR